MNSTKNDDYDLCDEIRVGCKMRIFQTIQYGDRMQNVINVIDRRKIRIRYLYRL